MSHFINLGLPHMIRRARLAADACAKGDWRGVDAIIYSAFAVEAFTNDFATIASKDKEQPGCTVTAAGLAMQAAEDERLQTMDKIVKLFETLAGRRPDKGAAPLQDLSLLLTLRSVIVHTKPDEVVFVEGRQQREISITRLLERLDAAGAVVSPNLRLLSDWRYMLDQSPAVAVWSVNTARAVVVWIREACPDSNLKSKWLVAMTGPGSSMYDSFNQT